MAGDSTRAAAVEKAARAGAAAEARSRDRRFAEDVRAGLTAGSKSLPCVYFYDTRGSSLFELITLLPEYYLTRAEAEIISEHAADIAALAPDPVQVVELGSGTSVKTATLLEALLDASDNVTYLPVDVCAGVLERSAEALREAMPDLVVRPVAARYEEGLRHVNGDDGAVLLLWLGSSIGNFGRRDAAGFLSLLARQLAPRDRFLIGIDLVKDAAVLEAAYNDRAGVTAQFNKNMLARINRELGGEFDLEQFRHLAIWNAAEGRIEMYLESLRDQSVSIAALDTEVRFGRGERVHTENSHKYTFEGIEALAERAGLAIERQWLDPRKLFSLNSLRVDGPT